MRQVAAAFVLLASSLAAQEGWGDFGAGDVVVVHKKGGGTKEGVVEEITSGSLRLEVRKGSMRASFTFPRADVDRLAAPKVVIEEPAANGSEDGEPLPEPPTEIASVEFSYGDGGKPFKGFLGSKVTLRARVDGRPKKLTKYELTALDGSELVLERFGMEQRVLVADILEIEVVELPKGVAGGEDTTAVGGGDDWPPGAGVRVKVLLEGDTEFIRGAVIEADGDKLKLLSDEVGEMDLTRDQIRIWKLLGVSISYLDMARLIRHYAIEINPDYAARFLPSPGLERARAEELLLGEIKVKPPVLDLGKLPRNKLLPGKPATLERRLLRKYYDYQRSRYLAVVEHEVEYFFLNGLFEDDGEVRAILAQLRKERRNRLEDVDTQRIGQSLANVLKSMSDAARAMNPRTQQEEKDALLAQGAIHRDVQTRFLAALAHFERFRRLAYADDELLGEAITAQWDEAYKRMSGELQAQGNAKLRERIDKFDMPRPWTAVFQLSEMGRNDVIEYCTDLYANARKVPYLGEEWLFSRGLRQIKATMLPPRNTYKLKPPGGATDRGHAGVYHLNVYEHEGIEICRMAIFRIEPELHVRVLFYRDRLLFSEAEEWIRH